MCCVVAACVTPTMEPDPSGIPDRSVTECQKVSATSLGAAQGVFQCRGRFVQGPSGFVGAYKGSAEDSYSLLSVNDEGEAVGRRVTDHRGDEFVLEQLPDELLVATWTRGFVRYGLHGSGLGGRSSALRSLELREGHVLHVAAAAIQTGGPGGLRARANRGALIVAATGLGVDAWLIDANGVVVVSRRILSHPEMKYCAHVSAAVPDDGGFQVTLRCAGVLPLPPETRETHAIVRDFDWGAKVDGVKEITVQLDEDLLPSGVTMVDGVQSPAPPRYALRRYLEEELPREPGERARVLDAVTVGAHRHLSLGCIGPDGGPIRVEATVVTCSGGP